ncbi:RNA-binding transcriptional accessory protein [Segatella bryantii]|uniref:RNA-binding transcriptional accessory protein n=1 Tax=Segatella bryantii TaxID=77095 RepID=A0ABX4EJE7_SEGBR|nr:RNA-binding transcriptional accessory protein [Segatella bryantii]
MARELGLAAQGVDNTIALLDEGCTIPFISRYRKERTGNMDEVQIAHIAEMLAKLKELAKRKETILKSIEDQGKLTDELKKRIDATWESSELEDIYLPYKPKRRTRAQIARELGLEPLAMMIMLNQVRDVEGSAQRFVKGDVKSVDDAIKGAEDIIAEMVSEDERVRQNVRSVYRREATITSKVVAKMKDDEKAQKYSDYFDWSEPLKRCTSHRLLAMRRGENEGILRVTIAADDEECTNRIKRNYQYNKYINEAIDDAFKRLIKPSMETEFAGLSKEKADEEAIHVFTENLRQLLLAAPLGQKRVLGVDPGIRTGCKIVCIDAQGNLLHHEVAHIANQRDTAERQLVKLVNDYKLEAIAIGNGTYSREASDFIHGLHFDHEVQIFVVSEDGASVYSASETAREEFPDQDVTVRGAVSIARRLMDPLAELVKIDPKSIGVGQYQHDVDQSALKKSLDTTVELCVNSVGVNLNTASKHLLTYVSGLGPALAQNIVNYRKENGAFTSRAQLKKVPRLGPSAYEQCAGFLRIPEAKNPLDNSAVHPESYKVVEQMAKDCGCKVIDLMKNADLRKKIDIRRYVTDSVGMPTLQDIMKELEKPGLDPRDKIEVFEFDKNVHTPEDLVPGMELPGIVTNITNFGAFVDVGVHQDGLVHISQLADKYISDPAEVVKLHQHVRVKVLEVDLRRHRISLTMKGL